MRFARLSSIAALVSAAAAQNTTFLAEFLQELQRENLTSLAQFASQINGSFLLSELGTKQQTIFAPNNNACA